MGLVSFTTRWIWIRCISIRNLVTFETSKVTFSVTVENARTAFELTNLNYFTSISRLVCADDKGPSALGLQSFVFASFQVALQYQSYVLALRASCGRPVIVDCGEVGLCLRHSVGCLGGDRYGIP